MPSSLMSSKRPTNGLTSTAPAFAAKSPWFALKTSVQFVRIPSPRRRAIASSPVSLIGIFTTTLGAIFANARPCASMPSTSSATTSAETGPFVSAQTFARTDSYEPPPALANNVGFVVTPSSTPQRAAVRISSISAVSRKIFIARLAADRRALRARLDSDTVVVGKVAAQPSRHREHQHAGDGEHDAGRRDVVAEPQPERDGEDHDRQQVQDHVARRRRLHLRRHGCGGVVDEAEQRRDERADDAEPNERDAHRRPERIVRDGQNDVADDRADEEPDGKRDQHGMNGVTGDRSFALHGALLEPDFVLAYDLRRTV